MGTEHSFATRQLAQEFYVVDGMTYEQAAAQTGVSVQAIKEWSTAEKWRDKRIQYRQDLQDIKASTVKLRKKLMDNALDTLNPMDVFAVAKMEALAARGMQNADVRLQIEKPENENLPVREIKTAEEAVLALDEALTLRVNAMLTQPGALNLGALRDLRKALELLREMKDEADSEQAAGTEAQKKAGLSPDAVQKIRKQILGIET